MAINTNQTYVLTGEDVQAFNRDYESYGEFRNAFIKISENQPRRPLLRRKIYLEAAAKIECNTLSERSGVALNSCNRRVFKVTCEKSNNFWLAR